jgi:osmotically-inducible protein OsmY
MNTAVQKTHKLVVGTGVGVVAIIGICVAALDVHRVAVTRPSTSPAAAPSALPDTPSPAATTTAPPPPPLADSTPSPAAAAANATPADAATSAPAEQANAAIGTAKSPRKAASPAPMSLSKHSGNSASGDVAVLASNTPTSKVAEETAMAKVPATQSAASAGTAQLTVPAASDDVLTGSGASSAAASGAAESRSSASGVDPASAAPAVSGGEITSTMQAKAAGADSANADRMITSAVKSQIAADAAEQGANLAVTTVNGVVILTGTVPTADAVERAKQVAQQVQDVKGVDATAVRVSGS